MAAFLRKIRKFKMAAIFSKTKFFENWHGYCADTLWVKNFVEIALAPFSRYKHFYVLQFCEKFENSKWPPFFARQNFFSKLG